MVESDDEKLRKFLWNTLYGKFEDVIKYVCDTKEEQENSEKINDNKSSNKIVHYEGKNSKKEIGID